MLLRNYTVDSIFGTNYFSCNVCKIVENIHPQRICNLDYMRRYVVAYPGYGCISISSSY